MNQTLTIRNSELEECLEILVRWRTSRSNDHHGITASRSISSRYPDIKEMQQKVLQILEENPTLVAPVIADAIRSARDTVLQGVPGEWRNHASEHIPLFTLEDLLKTPLAWRDGSLSWRTEPAWGRWRPYVDEEDREDSSDFDNLETDFNIQRLGWIADAWVLEEGGEIREVIECWAGEFIQPDINCCALHWVAQAELLYRYQAEAPEDGRAYVHIEDALRGEGGVSLEEAFKDGQRFGLVLPETLDEPGIDEVPR
jgi:hypothetical protein